MVQSMKREDWMSEWVKDGGWIGLTEWWWMIVTLSVRDEKREARRGANG